MDGVYHNLKDPAGLLPKGYIPKWPAEPPLGAWFTESEVDTVIRSLRESLDYKIGFQSKEEVEAFESEFASYIGINHAVVLNGAGTALDLTLRALDLNSEAEVISCSLNFHGTHLAVLGTGAKLILCEPDVSTMNIDPEDLLNRVTEKTRAIVVTHLHGLSADMNRICGVADECRSRFGSSPAIIVDAARALGATFNYEPVGRQGYATIFSLQSKKHITALGEGGVVVTNCNKLNLRLRQMRSFGLGNAWGSNYKITKLQAAVARVQLQRLDDMNTARTRVANDRTAMLRNSDYILPAEVNNCRHTYYLYPLLLPKGFSRERRDRLMANLAKYYGVGSIVANPPTYQYNTWIRDTVVQRTPLAEEIASRIICPSFHPLMSHADNEEICFALTKALGEI